MSFPRASMRWLLMLLTVPVLLPAQTTTINVTNTPIQTNIRRFGINLGTPDFYDSGQMTKNLVFTNPSFEGEIYQSTIRCATGTNSSCTDENIYSGWPTSFWTNATYTMITGSSAGRSGTICSYVTANWPVSGGVFSFCDSTGATPAPGDYMVVKATLPANVGWPGGDWQTVVGGGTLTAETNDMPPGTTGKQSALLTAPTASDSIAVNMFFDSTIGKTFLQLNGQYQLTFKAKGVSGSQNLAISLTRGGAGLTYINETLPLTNSWAPYTLTFNASETGTAIGRVELSFTAAGPDTVELDDVSLMQINTDPTNQTVFRDEVVNALKTAQPGVLRYWMDQLGESLDNLLANPQSRQRSGYTPYGGYDGTDVNFQTQSLKVGLTDFLQLCQQVGAEPWIVVPSTFSTGEAYSLIDYLAGPSSTYYGGIRAAAGQTEPWTSVFKTIHLEFGNEEWNGGTFKGGAIEYPDAYGGRASAIFASIKGNPAYVQSSFDLIVNGQSAAPSRNQSIQSYTTNNDSFSIAPYMMYNINEWATTDHLFGTTFAEAEAFVTPSASAEGVSGGYITVEQNAATGPGTPIVTSEMNLSPTGTPSSGGDGPMTQAAMNGYASSVGAGVAVLDSMFQQLRIGVLTQNLFALPGYDTATQTGTTAYLWGAVVDMGATNRKRPQFLALQLANEAIGNSTQMLETQHTGADPTDNQYDYDLNSVTLPEMHFLQSFAFTGNGTSSLVVFNVSPDYAEQVNFAGPNAPAGTVVMQQLWSTNITDTNELSTVVVPTSTTISNFNPASYMTLPPYSMTVFTWGSNVQAGPVISNVAATNITANSATITWTTDQASSSQVNYGATTAYGSQSVLNSTLTTTHSVTITGLTAGSTYDYQVVSANSSSASTASANFTFSTLTAAPVLSSVAASAITTTSATITWSTDQASTSQVNYGTSTAYGSQSALNSTLATAHAVTISGLTPNTTYDYQAISKNSANNTGTSANLTFTTTQANPVISAVTVTSITSTSASITWTTDESSSSTVSFGTTTAYGSTATGTGSVTSHSVSLTGLQANTSYHFLVTSVNSTNGSSSSADATFTTAALPNPVISSVAATSITSASAVITWTTDESSSSTVNYGTTTSYGSTGSGAGSVTAHSVSLSGLQPSTTYHFKVTSVNSTGGSSTSADATFTTTAAAAPVISAVTATSITTNSATITWTTDQSSTSVVNYGTTSAYGSSATGTGSTTSHSVTLSNLTPGTVYNFDVASMNTSNVTATSANFTFTTLAGTPVLSAVTATNVTSTSVTITWTTDQQSTSQVAYGTTTSYGSTTTVNASLVTAHSVNISGLTPNTTYDYQALSTNSGGTTGYSANLTFTTSQAPAPSISNVAVSGITTTSATVSWTTDQSSSSIVNYGTTAAYGSQASGTGSVTSHSVTLTNLTPGTAYNFDAVSANSSNASATSSNYTFTTTAASASTGPVISSVAAWPITNTTATILWVTDQPSTSQVNYGVSTAYGSQTTLDSTLNIYHAVVISGLNPGTTYHFSIVTTDGGGTSASADSNFMTTGSAPANPGPVISAVTASAITTTGVTITWTTDLASSSQVSYGTSTAYGTQSALSNTLVTSHSVTLSGLTPGTTYDYDVASVTGSGGASASANFTFTTAALAGASGPVISSVAAWPITNTTATILWVTDQPSTSQVNYGTTTAYGSQTQLDSTLNIYHAVVISGLNPGTTYHFSIVTTDAGGSSTSPDSNFMTTGTAPANPGPVISAVTTTGVTATAVTITWTTDLASTSQVSFGNTTAYGMQSTLNSALVTAHSVTLSGLTPGTTYDFAVSSVTGGGGASTSANYSFETASAVTPEPVISAVTATGVTANSATITWTTDQASSSQVAYGATSAYGSQSPANGTAVTSHSVTLTGLTAGTLYDFAVTSGNSNGSTTSSNYTFTTTTAAPVPPVISQVAFSGVTSTSATITWTTDQPATSQVVYGTTTGYGSQSAVNGSLATSHSVTLTGLTAGTAYDFAVVSANSSSQSTTSPNFTFATPAAGGPVISSLAVWPIGDSTATILWVTDVNATSQVNYGTTSAYGQQSALDSSLDIYHAVALTGLTSGTTYHYSVVTTNSSGVTSTSPDATFTTTGTAPIVGPVISAVTSASLTNTTATITWTTDQASNSQISWGPTSALGVATPLDSAMVTSHSETITGLAPGTVYYYAVISMDAAGGVTTSGTFSFLTTGSLPAPVISAVVDWGVTGSSATITWSTDQLADSQVLYGTTTSLGQTSPLQPALTNSHGVTLTGLNGDTTYYFEVRSANSVGSAALSTVSNFTTQGVTGPVISNVAATPMTGNAASVSWTSSEPVTIQIEYGPDTSYGRWTAPTTTSPTALGWTPSGTVHFRIHATDANYNTTVTSDYTFIEP